jgi:5-formyltetrahydrofolate cyclo-ligase
MVGYDEAGNRLGYGKGFYDRFLSAYKEAKSIGLAYSCQKVSALPVDEYDVRPDKIITEET